MALRPFISYLVNYPRMTSKKCKDELISNILRWTPTHKHTIVGQPGKTYNHQLYPDTVCCLKDLPGAMTDSIGWQERVKGNSAISMP